MKLQKKEIINKLTTSILENAHLIFTDIPCGPYEWECSCCGATERRKGNEGEPSINKFDHYEECPYILAEKVEWGFFED